MARQKNILRVCLSFRRQIVLVKFTNVLYVKWYYDNWLLEYILHSSMLSLRKTNLPSCRTTAGWECSVPGSVHIWRSQFKFTSKWSHSARTNCVYKSWGTYLQRTSMKCWIMRRFSFNPFVFWLFDFLWKYLWRQFDRYLLLISLFRWRGPWIWVCGRLLGE